MRLQIKHALVQYGANKILEDVDFEIRDREKIAVVGRNGCGKTTLLKLIAGDIQMDNPDSDEACKFVVAGKQQIGFLRQISFEEPEISVEQELKKAFAPVFACEDRMRELEALLHSGECRGREAEQGKGLSQEEMLQEYALLQNRMEALGGYSWRQDMEIMFQRFGFLQKDLQRPIGSFSGGQQTKVAFMKLLLSKPDIMLLDEPTNHLDLPTVEWLESYLKEYDRAVVIVSHDRMFLDRVTQVTYEIEYHRIRRYAGNYSDFIRRKEENLARQEKDYEEQQKEIKRLTDWIEKWKNTPTKVSATRSKRMAIEHMVKIEKPRRFDTRTFHARFAPRRESYMEVLTARNLGIGYDRLLCRVSFMLRKGERLAVLGENGKGKSTLLKTLTGEIGALGGSFTVGTNVEWGYFDQQRALQQGTDPDQTVLENFWEEYPSLLREEVRSALGSFLFSQEEVEKKLGQLSGGERVRLALCKMFQARPNLLILDEPTNHMDMAGREALEKMLQVFTGTVLFVSHDRYFIRQVATGILAFEQEGVIQYTCGYEEYLLKKPGTQAPAAIGKKTEAMVEKTKTQSPTLADVFDKKTYYNPGKVRSRLERQLEKYEAQLHESEEESAQLQLQMLDPALSSDYEGLMALQKRLEEQQRRQESLLERMLETETQLEDSGLF